MSFSYDPLWKLLIEREMTKEQLRTALELSPSTIAKMGKKKNVSMDVLDRICLHLDCQIEDVVKHVQK
ncbi:helix-turn-helix transcriptional regulator [Priestia koreensis]|uniref:helix-turn-helix domain-containing protein n=1 Tax=Priestia koreensis TaxID=284581 RepID=UPI003016DF8A